VIIFIDEELPEVILTMVKKDSLRVEKAEFDRPNRKWAKTV
jgi:hypothetical protein